MARARKSHIINEEKVKTRSGPVEYPYVVYCSYHREGEEHPRCLVLKFTDPASARNMVDQVIGNDEWEWSKWMNRDDMVVTSKGIKIRAWDNEMREIMKVDPDKVKREEIKYVSQFKYGSPEGGRKEDPVIIHRQSGGQIAAVLDRAPKPVKEKKPKIDTSGMVTANDIAKELKVEGREVRGVLRSMKLEKPAHGWAWPKDEATKIKEKVHAGLKETKAKKK